MLCNMTMVIALTTIMMTFLSTAMSLTCDTMKEHGAVLQYWNVSQKQFVARSIESGEIAEGGSATVYYPVTRTIGFTAVPVGPLFDSRQWALIDLSSGMQKMIINFKKRIDMETAQFIAEGDRLIVILPSDYDKIFHVNLKTGTVNWRRATRIVRSTPAIAVVDGIPYAIGGGVDKRGYSTSSVSMLHYDKVARTWKEDNKIFVSRKSATSVVHNGILYICGGNWKLRSIPFHSEEYYAKCLVYNFTTGDKFEDLSIPCGTVKKVSTSVINNEIYVIGVCIGGHYGLCMSKLHHPGSCKHITNYTSDHQVVLPCQDAERSRGEKSPNRRRMSNYWIAVLVTVSVLAY